MKKLRIRSLFCVCAFVALTSLIAWSPQVLAQDAPRPDVEFPDIQIDAGEDFGEDFGFDMGDEMEAFGESNFNADGLDPEAAAAMTAAAAAMTIGMIVIGILGFILLALTAYLLSDAMGAVPEQFREIPSWLPWLLLVPFINIVILIVAFIKVPKSLSRYLESKGDTSMGDCGASNGLWGSILYLLGCTFPIGLVLLVMAVLKINQAKKLVRAA